MKYFTHDTAVIDEGAKIGKGTKIWHWTHVSSQSVVGRDCSIGQNVYIANDVVIGNECKIQNNVSIYDSVRLEDHVFCGPSMVFTNVINPRSSIERKDEYRTTLVKKGLFNRSKCYNNLWSNTWRVFFHSCRCRRYKGR